MSRIIICCQGLKDNGRPCGNWKTKPYKRYLDLTTIDDNHVEWVKVYLCKECAS